jgi:hypothetical protein
VRKLTALSKFLGACLERVSMDQMLIETLSHVDTEVNGLSATSINAEEHSKIKDDELRNLVSLTK